MHKALVRTPEGNRPLRRPQCKRHDSVEIKLGGVRWDVMDRIDMAQERERLVL